MRNLLLTMIAAAMMPFSAVAQYQGSASVSQGEGNTLTSNLYNCANGRMAPLGEIQAQDNTNWELPAKVNYEDDSFPFAADLHNPCNGNNYPNAAAALNALNSEDIVTVDADGEVITAYVFADNYFEMYINGVAVGKDNVPFTQFNSNIIQFRVNMPFTIAMLLVDWEESLGLGTENGQGSAYHPGDGGMVAVFKNTSDEVIAITNGDWKAQTYYTAPIDDLSCPTENGSLRLSDNCNSGNSNDATQYYALHWPREAGWETEDFDDSSWPTATTYTNETIGVNNKSAYTNFTEIFDDSDADAQFIWSTNVILDNEVIVRHTVGAVTSVEDEALLHEGVRLFPNPYDASSVLHIQLPEGSPILRELAIYSMDGRRVLRMPASVFSDNSTSLGLDGLVSGVYQLHLDFGDRKTIEQLVVVE